MLKNLLERIFKICFHDWEYFTVQESDACVVHKERRHCVKCNLVEIFHDGRDSCCSTGSFSTGWQYGWYANDGERK